MLYHVVAMARNRVIGQDNQLPWHFSEDLKYFKTLTSGSTVIMGRKTHESIGRPLPNRQNFVLSRQARQSVHENVRYFASLDEALRSNQTEKCFIIGGGDLFSQSLDRVDGVYLTEIDADFEGDTYYPELPDNFVEASRTRLQESPVLDAVFYKKQSPASLELI